MIPVSAEVVRAANEAIELRELNARLKADRETLIHVLRSVIIEADFVLSGGDNPCEVCQECGLAGVGMLRDALNTTRVVAGMNVSGRIVW